MLSVTSQTRLRFYHNSVIINNVLRIEELDHFRSRLRWAEDGEKSNTYFLGLEKRNSRKKQCKKVVTDSVTTPEDILNMQCEFYKKYL